MSTRALPSVRIMALFDSDTTSIPDSEADISTVVLKL